MLSLCCGTWSLLCKAWTSLQLWRGGLIALQHMNLSSPTRDQTCIPLHWKAILNHWPSREVPQSKPYSLCFICDAYFTDGDTGTAEVVACLSDRAKAAEDISEVCPHHSLFLAQLSHLPLHFLLPRGSSFIPHWPTGSFLSETAQLQPPPASLALLAVFQPLHLQPGWLRPPSAY